MAESRIVTTDLNNILSLVHCAEDYGYDDDVFYVAMAEITGRVTDEEIRAYADNLGYDEEDAAVAFERLVEWRARYTRER